MRRILSIAFALALVLTTAGFRGCDEGQRRSVEQNVVSGVRVTAKAFPAGIETMRSLREAGEVDAQFNLELAEGARDVNSALQAFSKAALGNADAQTLLDKLEVVVNLASDLERRGTLHLKNGKTRLVFQLGVIAAKNGLVIARDEFKASGGVGLSFTLDAGTRESLEALGPQFDRNDELLREAIARLKGSSQ